MRSSALVAALGLAATVAASPVTRATAVLKAATGGKVDGTVTFTKVEGGLKVSARISGLTPGTHGFHVHEFGDCSAADFTSAGGHFNPAGEPHAGPKDAKRHAGDMGNVEADKDGVAQIEYVDPVLSFEGPASVLGRGVIVHAAADDLKTQPTGNAGGRLACAVVGVAKAP
jgi:Cu-Zn family superoxide dismutase